MCTVNIYELKTNLSKYLDMLEKGDESEIIISRYDKKIAKITLLDSKENKKRVGCLKDKYGDVNFEVKKGFEDIPGLFGY